MSDRADALLGLSTRNYEDLAMLLCKQKLGYGTGRNVFVYRPDPALVVKHEAGDGFQNALEWEIWRQVQDDKTLSKWFAPCVEISGMSQWLLQKRTFPVRQSDLPTKVPAIFTDLKIQNWGWFENRPVCHDYGSMLVRLMSTATRKLVKADWWSHDI